MIVASTVQVLECLQIKSQEHIRNKDSLLLFTKSSSRSNQRNTLFMIRTIKTFSVLTFRSSTSFTMCFLIPLFLIALFAPVIPAQFDTAYIPDIPDIPKYYPDDIQYYSDPTQHYTEEIQHYPDETQYYADVIKYNPDKPIVVPPIQSADDDATACQSDTHPDDGRATRACCRGSGEGRTRDGGFVKVNTCRKCTFRFLSSNDSFFSNSLHRNRLARRGRLQGLRYMVLRGRLCEFHRLTFCSWRGFLSTPDEFWCHGARER